MSRKGRVLYIQRNFTLFVFLEIKKPMVLDTWTIVLVINTITILLTIFISHISYRYFKLYFLRLKKGSGNRGCGT